MLHDLTLALTYGTAGAVVMGLLLALAFTS